MSELKNILVEMVDLMALLEAEDKKRGCANCAGCSVETLPHCHKCESCSTIWEHLAPPRNCSKELFDKVHACPRCGKDERYRYRPRAGEKIDFPWTGSWE